MSAIARDSVLVHPVAGLSGRLSVAGDKSISHRSAMFAALAEGSSRISGFLESGDCLATLRAMESLGAAVEIAGKSEVVVQGTGGEFKTPSAPLDMGNSGTGMRLLAGLLSGFDIEARLEGDASLSSRPMGRIATPLAAMGADIRMLGADGRPPLLLRGGGLRAIDYELPVASAQVKSAVLMAGAMAAGRSSVTEPRPTRDHSERIMAALGLPITVDGLRISIEGSGGAPLRFAARDWRVPGDFSSAAFWMLAAAATPDARLEIDGVGLNPRRTAFLDVLVRMGARIELGQSRTSDGGEVYGDMQVRGGALAGTAVGGDEIPNLIDECPLVAVAGALASGSTEIRDAAELRVKESDRIAVMCANLAKCGVAVEERPDGMLVQGARDGIRGGVEIESHGDHRIAMAMTILALFAREPLLIRGVGCIATSYPDFWEHLELLGGKIERGV
jgi:3-phosphoshikimate 1-carboxyvinyltransferase